jgi:LmbE family N-acetylglucosaminyl deacetylase
MHSIFGLAPDEDAPLHRRKEDAVALGHLGVSHQHGRFPDSIYRRLQDGRWLAAHVEGKQKLAINDHSPDSDRDLVADVTADLESVLGEFEPTLIITCLGIGEHPDHEAARDAALFAAREKNVPVRLWEDLPYAVIKPGAVELPAGFGLGADEFSSVQPEVQKQKFQAIELYSSQLALLNGEGNVFDQLTEHARKNSPHGGYGERTWSVIRNNWR